MTESLRDRLAADSRVDGVSILSFVLCLIVDVVLPLGIAARLLRSNYVDRPVKGREWVFWIGMLGYLVVGALIGWAVVEITLHPQPEGFIGIISAGFFTLIMAPGSIPALVLSVVLRLFARAEPLFLPTYVAWFVVGALAWAFADATILRRLVPRSRAARSARQASSTQ